MFYERMFCEDNHFSRFPNRKAREMSMLILVNFALVELFFCFFFLQIARGQVLSLRYQQFHSLFNGKWPSLIDLINRFTSFFSEAEYSLVNKINQHKITSYPSIELKLKSSSIFASDWILIRNIVFTFV